MKPYIMTVLRSKWKNKAQAHRKYYNTVFVSGDIFIFAINNLNIAYQFKSLSNFVLLNIFSFFSYFLFRKEYACKVKLTAKRNANGTFTYKTNNCTHTHIIDAREMSVKTIMQNSKDAAKTTSKPSRKLFGEALGGVSDEVIAKMPNQGAFSKRMRVQRKGDHPKAPKDLTELELPEVLNSVGDNFLLFDSGPSNDRIVMFGSQKAIEFLSKCDVLHMDGTVSTGPVLFDQVYTIHGKFIFHFLFSLSISHSLLNLFKLFVYSNSRYSKKQYFKH